MNTTTERKYTVEGHGTGMLMVDDGRHPAAPSWVKVPYLSRRAAWEAAKRMMARTDLHTVKVMTWGNAPAYVVRKVDADWIEQAV